MSTVMTYTNVNGYLIPNLTYKSSEQMEHLTSTERLRKISLNSLIVGIRMYMEKKKYL